jgi:hypothetical protein
LLAPCFSVEEHQGMSNDVGRMLVVLIRSLKINRVDPGGFVFPIPIPCSLLLTRWPGHWATTEQMDVNVVDGLPAIFAGVDHGAIALCQPFGAGYFGGCPMKMADQGVVLVAGVGDGCDVLARNDKDVYRRLRIDVGEGVALVVLVEGFGRNTSIDDLAKETTHN